MAKKGQRANKTKAKWISARMLRALNLCTIYKIMNFTETDWIFQKISATFCKTHAHQIKVWILQKLTENFMQFVSNFQKNNARMTSFSIENHIYVHLFYLCTSKFCTFQQHYLNLLPLARILGVDKIGHSATWSR